MMPFPLIIQTNISGQNVVEWGGGDPDGLRGPIITAICSVISWKQLLRRRKRGPLSNKSRAVSKLRGGARVLLSRARCNSHWGRVSLNQSSDDRCSAAGSAGCCHLHLNPTRSLRRHVYCRNAGLTLSPIRLRWVMCARGTYNSSCRGPRTKTH